MLDLPNKALFRPDEVAVILQVSIATIYRECEDYVDTLGADGLPWIEVRGQKRIRRDALLSYLKRKPYN